MELCCMFSYEFGYDLPEWVQIMSHLGYFLLVNIRPFCSTGAGSSDTHLYLIPSRTGQPILSYFVLVVLGWVWFFFCLGWFFFWFCFSFSCLFVLILFLFVCLFKYKDYRVVLALLLAYSINHYWTGCPGSRGMLHIGKDVHVFKYSRHMTIKKAYRAASAKQSREPAW